MPQRMPHDTTRARSLRRLLEEHAESNGGVDRLPKQKIVVKGKASVQPVYTVATDQLLFNAANGRIKAEVFDKESELGRKLDHYDSTDQEVIANLLLSIRQDENEKIRKDIVKNGQLTPRIVTCDGIVINGNRRKALLEQLHLETGEDKYRHMEVQVLPADIDKAEIWLIEAGVQMSASQQLDYSPINNLLKLKEGVLAGLELHRMAARIYGVSEVRIQDDLERLDLIDQYLEQYLGKPGRYHLVNGLNEHFIDLQNILSWVKSPRGNVKRDWEWDESDINELKLVAFVYIRMRMPHMRIRGLRELFALESSWSELRKTLDTKTTQTEEEHEESDGAEEDFDESDDNGECDEDLDSGPESTSDAEDKRQEEVWRRSQSESLKRVYEDAKEQEQVIKDRQRPLALARRALRNIEAIPDESELDDEIDSVLAKIILTTNRLRKLARPHRVSRPKKKRRPRIKSKT